MNTHSFGRVISSGDTTLDVQLDNGSFIRNAPSSVSATTEDRVALLWDDQGARWVVVSRITTPSIADISGTAFSDLTDAPTFPVQDSYLAYTNGGLSWVAPNEHGGPLTQLFTSLSDTPTSLGAPGSYVTVSSDGLSLIFTAPQDITGFLTRPDVLVDATIIKTNGSGNSFTLSVGPHDHSGSGQGGTVSHTVLTDLTSGDPHTQYASSEGVGTRRAYEAGRLNRTVTAGDGIDGGGILTSDISIDVDSTVARDTWAINAGLGLAGGGNLSPSGITLDIGAGDGIDASADSIAVDVTDLLGTGTLEESNNIAVDQSYGFTWTSEHTFQADIQLDANLDFIGPQSITTTTGDLTVASSGNIILNPTGNQVIFSNWSASDAIQSSNYVSQSTGWSIAYGTSGGHADFRSMYADELHVQAFIADIYQAVVGGLIITEGRARLSRNFAIPTNTNTNTMYLEDLEGFENAQVFSDGDYVRLRYVDTSGGGLIVTDAWGTVTSYTNLTGGEQSWTFTTTDDGGLTAPNNVIYQGAIALGYGQSGSGVWEATVLDSAGSPYSQVQTWVTDPSVPGNFTTHLRLGNLDGISGVGLEYGLWAGQDTETFILLSDNSFETHGLRVSLYNSFNQETIRLDPTTPYIAIGDGTVLPTGPSQDGIWMGYEASDQAFELTIQDTETPEGVVQYLKWTKQGLGGRYSLDIAGNVNIKNSSGYGGHDKGPTLTIDDYGALVMGNNGKIDMGTGSDITVGTGGTMTIGSQGSGAYLNYDSGVLTIEGKIIVTDGEDFLSNDLRPEITSLYITNTSYDATYLDFQTGPFMGNLTTHDGSIYLLVGVGDGTDTKVLRANSRTIIMFVHKDGTGITHSTVTPSRDYWGILNSGTYSYLGNDYPNSVDLIIKNQDKYYTDYSQAERNNHVIIGFSYANSGLTDFEILSGAGFSNSTVVGPGYINTTSLSAIVADLGSITAGSIVVGSTNKLWLNDDATDATIALAIGGSTKASAPIRFFEDGQFNIGNGTTNYVDWNNTRLLIKGELAADAGYLGSLNVNGNLTMNGGRIQWNSNLSYIDNNMIRVDEVSTRSVLRIGDTAQDGLIDLDMRLGSGASQWNYGIHIADGANTDSGTSALFHGRSDVGGTGVSDAIDHIFEANTTTPAANPANTANGFYASMNGGSWVPGTPWNSKGVAFKAESLDQAPVAMFRRTATSGSGNPAVWVSSTTPSTPVIVSDLGGATMTAFQVVNTGGAADIVALEAAYAPITKVEYMSVQPRIWDGATVTGDIPGPPDFNTVSFNFHVDVNKSNPSLPLGYVSGVKLVVRTSDPDSGGEDRLWKAVLVSAGTVTSPNI